MKTNKLDVAYQFDYHLFGVVSNVKDFKLAWYLNERLTIDLKKQDDIRIEFNDQSFMLIANYRFENDVISFEVLKNKLINKSDFKYQLLIPELKQFDYLIKFKDLSDELSQDDLLSILKEIPVIEYVMLLNFDNLKSKENLLY
jgi:hypothetical protein